MRNLADLPETKSKSKKRIGRGIGSGKGGHTVGRGQKGQKVRGKIAVGFEGGQSPFYKRLPKYGGFKSFHGKPLVLNFYQLVGHFEKGETITPQKLLEKGLIRKIPKEGVKILGMGNPLLWKFEGVKLSSSARKKLEGQKG